MPEDPAGPVTADQVMTGFPVPTHLRVDAATVYTPPYTRWFMQHVREVERTASVGVPRAPSPLPAKPMELTGVRLADGSSLDEALRVTATDALVVLHHGAVIDERYFNSMRPGTPHLWQSVSKSLCSCVAANLAERGLIDVEERVDHYVPELAGSAYEGALVRHLLDMQVGVDYSEDYEDEDADVNELDRLYGARPPRDDGQPGSTYEFATRTQKMGRHGERFDYVSLNFNVLGWVMERAGRVRVPELIARDVWDKLGAEHEAYMALDGAGSAQSEGGFCSSVRDFARFGLALSQGGRLGEEQVVPRAWVRSVQAGGDETLFARSHEASVLEGGSYRLGFWVSRRSDRTVFMGLGIYGQLLYVDPAAQLVIAKFSTQPSADDQALFAVELALCDAVTEALTGRGS